MFICGKITVEWSEELTGYLVVVETRERVCTEFRRDSGSLKYSSVGESNNKLCIIIHTSSLELLLHNQIVWGRRVTRH